jgi:hypothetical protein
MDLYKTVFDTWRAQVDSSWQRSSYFSAIETAAIGGCWLMVSAKDALQIGTSIGFSIGGFLLTMIWYCSTKKTWGYVRHWWDKIREIEAELALGPYDFAQQLESKQERDGGVRYKTLLLGIPLLFSSAWGALFLIATVRFACSVR